MLIGGDENKLNEIETQLIDYIVMLDYVLTKFNIPHNECFAEIHRANMSKFIDNKPVKNEYGKIIKGSDFVPANLDQFFQKA